MENYKYEPRIEKSNNEFYAIIVCIDNTGYERVMINYKGKFFKTLSAAEKSTQKHINKFLLSLT